MAEEAYQCTMSFDELTVIRYVASYVVKTMLKKPDDPRSAQFLDCVMVKCHENIKNY